MRNRMRNWMLGMTLVAGLFTTGAVTANAAPLQFRVGVEENYVPPCPGDGYVWTAGYYNAGYWVPGVWNFRGRPGFDRGYGYGRGVRYDRGFGHGSDRGRGFDRGRGSDHGYRGRR
jgi:hypothetical protein